MVDTFPVIRINIKKKTTIRYGTKLDQMWNISSFI